MSAAKILLAGSIVANAACAFVLATRPSVAPPAVRDFFHLHDTAAEARLAEETRRSDAAAVKAKAAAAVATQAQLWSALDSTDLKTLVAHLRTAGFTAAQIRAIVSARIEARFAARRQEIASSLTVTPYWKQDVGGWGGNPKFNEQISQLFRERSTLMREVLGDAFFEGSSGDATAAQRREFGDLPKSKIDLIQRINDDYAEMTSQVRAATQGITLPEDREKLILLEKEKRADLAAVLTPEELRAYDMRSSTIATRLRSALGVMDATEDEFRTIYAIQEPLADRLYPVGGVKGAEMSRLRKEAQQQVTDQLTAALGTQRAADYNRATDTDYQAFYRLAQRENLPATAAATAYDLRNSTAVESRRIDNDKTLDVAAKIAAQQALAQSAKTAFVAALGPTAGTAYVQSSDWLKHIAGGGSITFGRDGSTTFYQAPKETPARPVK